MTSYTSLKFAFWVSKTILCMKSDIEEKGFDITQMISKSYPDVNMIMKAKAMLWLWMLLFKEKLSQLLEGKLRM
jgi:hypothetical protein